MKSVPRLHSLALALLLSAALPASVEAQTLIVTDISVTDDPAGLNFVIPSVEATDANLDEAAIRALFTKAFIQQAESLATLDAASIRIPEITVSLDMPNAATGGTDSGIFVYRDLELTNVRQGVAERASLGEIVVTGDNEGLAITFGEMSASAFDIGGILAFYGFGPGAQSDELRPIYTDFVFEGGALTSPMLTCTIEGATAAGFSARPLKGTFAELMKYTSELEAAEASGTPPSPEAIGAIIRYYADFFTAFESAPTEFGGFTCAGTDPQGTTFNVSTGLSAIGGFAPNIYPSIALNDFRIELMDQGWAAFDNFTIKQTHLGGLFETLLAVDPAALDQAWFEANWRRLVPAFDGLSLSGLSLDVPDTDRPGGRIVAGIDGFDLSLADYVNGLPASVATSGSGIRMSVPPGDDGAPLRALGIETLDLGFDIAAHWNQTAETISLERFALTGAGLGGVAISGTFANAGPDLFADDAEVANRAAAALTVTDLTIDLDNAGILPILLAAGAAEQQMPPEAFRLSAAGMAQALPLAMLGGTPEAMGLSQALGAFLTGTPSLSITLKATDPAGIGLADLQAAEKDPSVLKGKVAITATASGEPVPFVWPELPAPEAAPATPAETPTVLDQPATPAEAPPAADAVSPREAEKGASKN